MNPETYDTVWDSSNDYSYDDLISFEDNNDAAAITKKITLYADDKLVWGIEPDGTEPSPVPTEKILYGDSNCDKKVDMSDAVLIMQSLSNPDKYGINGSDPSHITDQGMLNADCCKPGDGVTNEDALAIQKLRLELIDSLPA